MMALDNNMQDKFSFRAIGVGVLASIIIYLTFVSLSFIGGSAKVEGIEAGLASQVIELSRPDIVEERYVDEETHSEVSQSSSAGMPPAPYEGLVEHIGGMTLPIVGKNNLGPFDAYRKQFILNRDKPAIAIMIKGYGLSSKLSREAVEAFPSNITFLLSPYADNAPDYQRAARSNGYEVWLEFPMENKRFPAEDPGFHGILSNVGLKDNLENYKWILSRAVGYAGLAGYSDERFQSSQAVLQNLFSDVFKRGLGYFEINPRGGDAQEALALKTNAPFVGASLFDDGRKNDVGLVFENLKLQAESNGKAIGVMNLTPALIEKLGGLVQKAEEEGFSLVPVSVFAKP